MALLDALCGGISEWQRGSLRAGTHMGRGVGCLKGYLETPATCQQSRNDGPKRRSPPKPRKFMGGGVFSSNGRETRNKRDEGADCLGTFRAIVDPHLRHSDKNSGPQRAGFGAFMTLPGPFSMTSLTPRHHKVPLFCRQLPVRKPHTSHLLTAKPPLCRNALAGLVCYCCPWA